MAQDRRPRASGDRGIGADRRQRNQAALSTPGRTSPPAAAAHAAASSSRVQLDPLAVGERRRSGPAMRRRNRGRNRMSRPYRPAHGSPRPVRPSVSTRSCGRPAFSTNAATRLSILPCSCSEAKSSTRIRGIVGEAEHGQRPVGTWSRICCFGRGLDRGRSAPARRHEWPAAGAGAGRVVTAGGAMADADAGRGQTQPAGNRSARGRRPARRRGNSAAIALLRRGVAGRGPCRRRPGLPASCVGRRRGVAQAPRLITCTRRLRGSGVCGGVGTSRPSSPMPTACSRLGSTPYFLAT